MATLTVEEAQIRLAQIIAVLAPGGVIVLTRDDRPGATLRATLAPEREAPRFGTLKGTVLDIAPDFDDIPEGFEEYLPCGCPFLAPDGSARVSPERLKGGRW